ncbi:MULTISPECIES: EVE domain-containing protein [unclassified Nostoc]|uniref:EVE domain-containing protein n=1 Tax=unclassified Nostoc TaxID=2593658 RepID=UPI0025AA425D|nr:MULTISPECIES: EVE domain-containing protein [unclassified Nostoc]MDM9583378.1 EVE domain-containing protein [Nostoc sp. GT001]MDZ7947707.1 EVE domain-containing protein [Nostoc sp. EfeVER01]MDZ7993617.1 EVE domain-containing protein [Nostoc sp. EspVER01]
MNYWLMKSEPEAYSIVDLQQQKETIWDGVRNYQARNFLRQMDEGDLAFFYHSGTNPPGIAGLMRVVKKDIADPTQFEPESKYYDPKSSYESPRWQTVVVEFVETFSNPILLSILKEKFSAEELMLVRQGNRLSVMPVPEAVALKILAMKNS